MTSPIPSSLASVAPPETSANTRPEILVVTRTFLPDAGGIEDYVYSRCLRSPERIAVLSASCSGDDRFDQQQSFPVHRWPTFSLPKIKAISGVIKQVVYLIWEFLGALWLYARYRYTALEWCHGYDFPVLLLLSYLLPVRCVMYLHGNDLLCPLRNPLLKPLFGLTLSRMDHIVCNSRFTQTYLQQHFAVEAPTIVLNPTVRPEKFGSYPTPAEAQIVRQAHGIPAQAILLLSVGRLVPRKGFDTVIELMPRLCGAGLDVHYLVCGQGKQQSDLQAMVKHLKLDGRVHFAGYVPDEKLASYYVACDIFTLPTCFNALAQSIEGFGIVYVEAGYFGKPVVACDVGGVSDAVKHNENGLLVTPDDLDAISGAIVRLCQDPDLRHQLGQKGKALATQNLPETQKLSTIPDAAPKAS